MLIKEKLHMITSEPVMKKLELNYDFVHKKENPT